MQTNNAQSSKPGVLLAKRILVQDESDRRRSKKRKLLESLKSSKNQQRQVDAVSFFRGAKNVHISGGTMTAIINNGVAFSGVTLIDAAGKRYKVSMVDAYSYEVSAKLLFLPEFRTDR